jgi:cell division protein FtsW
MSETARALARRPRSVAARPTVVPRASRQAAAKTAAPAGLLEHRILIGSVAGLCLLGLPVVLSASAVADIQAGASVYSLFVKQAVFLVLGSIVALAASRVAPEKLRKLHAVLPVVALGLLLAVFLPGLGHDAGGSSRWIGAGPIQIQPSELMKLAVVVFAADLLARRAKRTDHVRAVVVPLLQLVAVAGILIMKQPDLGSCIVIVCIAFSLLFAAGLPARILAGAFGCVAVPGAVLALDASYRRARLLSFLNPFAHASGTGYQVVQSLVTLGQGGLKGNGIGGSPTTWGYLPNGHTDFIFAVIGGNLGLLGTIGVIAGFAVFAWAGFRVAWREKDAFTRYVAVGITCWIVVQAVINIGGVVDALPVTGIPLPFISYGGSALVMTLAGAGILVGIARRQVPAAKPVIRPAGAKAKAKASGSGRPRRPRPALSGA